MTTPTTPAKTTTRTRTARKSGDPRADEARAHGRAVAEADMAKQAAKQAKKEEKTISDYRRELDAAIIVKAGELVAEVPAKLRAEVAQLIANQLHHLSTPKAGWPGSLPKPARSEWK